MADTVSPFADLPAKGSGPAPKELKEAKVGSDKK
jgi:hypothetical protein